MKICWQSEHARRYQFEKFRIETPTDIWKTVIFPADDRLTHITRVANIRECEKFCENTFSEIQNDTWTLLEVT